MTKSLQRLQGALIVIEGKCEKLAAATKDRRLIRHDETLERDIGTLAGLLTARNLVHLLIEHEKDELQNEEACNWIFCFSCRDKIQRVNHMDLHIEDAMRFRCLICAKESLGMSTSTSKAVTDFQQGTGGGQRVIKTSRGLS